MRPSLIFILTALLWTASLSAGTLTKEYNYESYDKAEEATSYLKFEMLSRKGGLIPITFVGYTKKFTLQGQYDENKVVKASISFPVKSLDTDINARNEKMYEESFSADKYPQITVSLKEPYSFNKELKEVKASINVRGKDHPFTLKMKCFKKDGHILAEGQAELDRAKLEIPDPSIWIASVDNKIKVDFKLDINLQEK